MSIGNHDNPVNSMSNDRLSMEAQVEGLAKYIQECETPLTISIQGSWGTGKTSFVNLVKDVIFRDGNNSEDIVFVPFNSWQFVQFDMSEQLSSNLIVAITKELGKNVNNDEAKKSLLDIINGMEVLKATGRLGVMAANNYVKEKWNVDVKQALDDAGFDDTDKILKKTKETVTALDTIANLKKNLQKMIDASLRITDELRKKSNEEETEKILRKKRVIIFVDDLDRLAPDKAIEVLEVLKMFLDCERCVFLLAIDYDVVVNGVTIKYRNSITEEKGRDFFEKMVQVVYTLPSTMNHTDRYIAEILDNNRRNISLAYDFAELVKKGDKDNPRAIKRLLNSYFLLDVMKSSYYKEEQNQVEAVVQFAVLCLQNICPDLYNYISEQYAGIYNYEKSVQWFNAFHKYCFEMSRLATSTVKIRNEKLEQWNLLKSDKKMDRVKLEFLCTFFDKINGNTFVKKEPGKQLDIQDILCLKKAIKWTNLVQGRNDGHTYLDNIAKIEVVFGGYKTTVIETKLGTIEEAYVLTVTKILELLLKEGMFDDSIFGKLFSSTAELDEYAAKKKEETTLITPEEVFYNTINLFEYILSVKEKRSSGWKEINVLDKRVWLRTDFEDIETEKRFDAIVTIVQLLSKYSKIGFSWFKDRRGKEVLATGYDSQEGHVYVEDVSFINVNGIITQIPKRNAEKAYVETVKQILECLDTEKFGECMNRFSSIVKYTYETEDTNFENEENSLQSEIEESLFSEEGDIWLEEEDRNGDFWFEEGTTGTDCSEGTDKTDGNNAQSKAIGDDLDEITPLEYESEEDKKLREIVATENEEGWFEGEEAINGWRYEALIIAGGQIDIKINVGIEKSKALMAMNAYMLSKYCEIDFTWYEDAYMKKVVNKGCIKENTVWSHLKNNCLQNVYRKMPSLFQAPDLYFAEDAVGFKKYKLPCDE